MKAAIEVTNLTKDEFERIASCREVMEAMRAPSFFTDASRALK